MLCLILSSSMPSMKMLLRQIASDLEIEEMRLFLRELPLRGADLIDT